MAAKLKPYIPCIAIGLILGGLLAQYGPVLIKWSPIAPGAIERAAIIGETGGPTPLTKEQLAVIQRAPDCGVQVFDRDIVGPDRKPPPELVAMLDAVKDADGYRLVLLRTNGKVEVYPLPATIDELKGIVQ